LGEDRSPVPLLVFVLVGAGLLAEQANQYSVAVLGARMRFGLVNAITIVGAVLRAVLIAAAILLEWGLAGVAGAYAIGAALTATATALAVQRVDPRYALTTVTADWGTLRPQLRFGLSSVLATFAGAILWQVHPLLIGAVAGTAGVAAFYVGMRFPMLVSEMNWRTAEVLFPAVSAMPDSADESRRATALSAGVRWLTFLVLPLAVLGAILAPPLLELWLHQVPDRAVPVFRLGVLVMLLDAWAVPALQVLWGLGKATRIAFTMVAAAAVAVALDLLLLPSLGQVAAPVAMLAGLALLSTDAVVQAARHSRMRVSQLVQRDVATFLPAAGACAVAASIGRWAAGPGHDLTQVVLGTLFGLAAYAAAVHWSGAGRAQGA
jgi:O-antigen/teichoic acid export membrane protein